MRELATAASYFLQQAEAEEGATLGLNRRRRTASWSTSPLLPPLSSNYQQCPLDWGPAEPGVPCYQGDSQWRTPTEEMSRLRVETVRRIELILRSHRAHDVLTQIPENADWLAKTLSLALKLERLMFVLAISRDHYVDIQTLDRRVRLLARQLVGVRRRKNVAIAVAKF